VSSSGRERQSRYVLFAAIAVIVILGGTLGFVYLSSVNQGNTISTLQGLSAAANNMIARENSTISNLRSQMSTDNFTISRLQAQISTDNSTKSQLEAQIRTDKAAMASLNSTIAYLEYLSHNSSVVISSLNATIAKDKATIASLNSTIASDNATIASLNSTIASDNATIASLKATIASDKEEISNLKNQISTLTTHLNFWQRIGNGSDYTSISSNGVLLVAGYSCSNLQQVSDFNQTAWSLLSKYSGQLYVSGYSGWNNPVVYLEVTYPYGLGPFATSVSSYASATLPIGSSATWGSDVPAVQFCNSGPSTVTLSTYASFDY
jgi:uncharacterized coiled-coil protein SlyX